VAWGVRLGGPVKAKQSEKTVNHSRGRKTASWPSARTSKPDCCSFRLDVGRLNHLVPLLGFVGGELREAGGSAGKLDQALDRLVVFDAPGLDQGIEGRERVLSWSRPSRFPAVRAWLSVVGLRALAVFVHPARRV
jgi:hypothetical protein